ncbi:MAG: hypothetical protein MUC85_09340 [Anaerolineales bacterium]|jgi:hypothetical protein|nr:hypothetical protein [Anaerolineales bacterium]
MTQTKNQANLEDSDHAKDPVIKMNTEEWNTIVSHLFGQAVADEGLREARAIKGLSPHLEAGESILLANTVKVKSSSCLTMILSVPDKFYSVALTEKRVLITSIKFLGGPSTNVKAYSYQELSTIVRRGDYCLLTTKSKQKYLFTSGSGTGVGADDFLRALFTYFYNRADKIIIPPGFENRDIKDALALGAVKVVISE